MKYPKISIIIPTFNSQKTLPNTLSSLAKQTYPKNKIEILILDGGSHDKTVEIAKKYSCKIIPNPRTELIYGKHLGYLHASGQYAMFLDSDESLENKNSLELKMNTFIKNEKVRVVMPTGYKSPKHVSPINDYVNEFGDPFSFFIYRESKGSRFLIKEFTQRFAVVAEDKDCLIFDFKKAKYLPLVEIWAGGCMIDLKYFQKKVPQATKDKTILPHLFYFLVKKNQLLGITKNDSTVHLSCASFKKYYKKLSSRITNNIFMTPMGKGGFEGRNIIQDKSFSIKKYFFIPYSFSIVFPLVDAIYLMITRKQYYYLMHILLCLYTSVLILYYYAVKLFGIKLKMKTYGN